MSIYEAMEALRDTFPRIPSIQIQHNLVGLSTGTEHQGCILFVAAEPICVGDSLETLVYNASLNPTLQRLNQEAA